MRQIKRGVFVKKRQKKPPCARGRGGEGAGWAGPRRSPSSVGADSISARGVCAGAGCGGMGASRPTVVWVVAAVPVRPEAQNSFVGAGFIPPAGVCAAAGCAGRCKHRPLQRFVVTPGYRFPGCRALAFVRRGGFHIRPGCLRRRGVRRDGGIPPYERPGGRGHPVWPETQNSFVGADSISARGVCGAAGCAGRCKHRPLQGFVVTRGYRFPGGRALAFVRRGGIYPARGVCAAAGCAGRCKHRPLQGFVVTRGRGFPVGRGICRAPFIRSRRSRRSLRPGRGPRARGRGPGPGFRPP